jgi:heptosyltransferase II
MAVGTWRHVLVRATNWLGDAIMCLPALHALRGALPEARITILGLPWVKELYEGESFADDFIEYPKGWKKGAWKGKRAVVAELRARNFDAALLLQNAFEAAAIVRLAGIAERVGYDRDGRGWLLTDAVETPELLGRHERFYYLELLRRAGAIREYDAESPIALGRASLARELGRTRLEGRFIGVSPGAAFGSAKRWYAERFAAAAVAIAKERGTGVAVFGSPEEKALATEVAAAIAAEGVRAENFAGRTRLREFIELAAAMELMLTNDSGAMHVAYAVGTPSVTVFGSTDHVGTGPVGALARIVREPVECSPCKLRECPIDHRCMTRIETGRVVDVALELLEKR